MLRAQVLNFCLRPSPWNSLMCVLSLNGIGTSHILLFRLYVAYII